MISKVKRSKTDRHGEIEDFVLTYCVLDPETLVLLQKKGYYPGIKEFMISYI